MAAKARASLSTTFALLCCSLIAFVQPMLLQCNHQCNLWAEVATPREPGDCETSAPFLQPSLFFVSSSASPYFFFGHVPAPTEQCSMETQLAIPATRYPIHFSARAGKRKNPNVRFNHLQLFNSGR